MKLNRNTFRILAVAFTLMFTVAAEARRGHHRNNPPPAGYDGLLVFIADGVYDPADPPPTSLHGDYFDTAIMGRNAAEKAAQRQDALDYFESDFGVQFFLFPAPTPEGVIGSNATGSIVLVHTYYDPRNNYRAVFISDKRTKRRGRIVHDASYAMVVTAPETLHGTYGGAAGIAADPGTISVFGEYLIQGTRNFHVGHRRNIHIRWHSSVPIVGAFNPEGFSFDCRLFSDDYGDGISIGRNFVKVLADGRIEANVRNVLTFPLPQWAMEELGN